MPSRYHRCITCSAAAEDEEAPIGPAHSKRRPGQRGVTDYLAGEVQPGLRRQVELRHHLITEDGSVR